MLMADQIKRKKKMSTALRDALIAEGIDPVYALILKQPAPGETEPVFHVLVSPSNTIKETNLRKAMAEPTDLLMPEGQQVLVAKLPDEKAAICKKIGESWVWIP